MQIPTIDQLRQSVLNDLRNKLNLSTIVGKFLLNAFALVQAAKLKLFYLALNFVYENIFPDTAKPQSFGGTLERFGIVKLERYPFSPTAGKYNIQVSGTVGSTIAPGTTLKSLDTSTSPDKMFVIDSSVTLNSSTESVEIRALELGTDALLQVDDQLQFTSPIDGVNDIADVKAVVQTPDSGESIEQYRTNILNAFRIEAQGGAKGDYVLWASDVASVRRVYPQTSQPGYLTIYVEATEEDLQNGNGVPHSQTLTAVENAIDSDPDTGKARKPMGMAEVNAVAVILINFYVDITNLSDGSYLTEIENSINSFLKDIRPFRAGVDNPQDQNQNKLYLADIYDIVRNTVGTDATFDKVELKLSSDDSNVDVYEFNDGNIPNLIDGGVNNV